MSIDNNNNLKLSATLKVIGVGGAGCNAVNSMISDSDCTEVEFIVTNTDAQALELSKAPIKIQIGTKISKGLGAGSNPEIGRRAAEEDLDAILKCLEGTEMVFITAGLGGGTGSGAASVIAQAAKERGILTLAIVTKPFAFEGRRRMKQAEDAASILKDSVDTLLIVPNQKLLEFVDPKISMLDAFAFSNSILKQAIKGISDIIKKPGLINVDFADVRTVMKDMGMAVMGTGRASGEGRARNAAMQAISSPILENGSIEGARGILLNITGNNSLGLQEIHEAASIVHDLVSEDANIILGSVIDEEVGDDIIVTVIATGFDEEAMKIQQPYNRQMHSAINPPHRTPLQQKPMPQPIHRQTDTQNSPFSGTDNLDTPTFMRKKEFEQ
ncbi:cell division protein FtsZ [Candidatus Dependentiae bacterium]|nr:cell division protein FtsZ [Candidatus Dependentiae bacterium]